MKTKSMNHNPYLTYAEVDLKALRYNFRQINRLASRTEFYVSTRPQSKRIIKGRELILAVVKADAYGHGMRQVAALLHKEKVGFFGVSDAHEGIALRRAGIKKPVLLFESTMPTQASEIIRYRLMPTVCTLELARALDRIAGKNGKKVDIHIKVDTGMGRLGIWHKEAYAFIHQVHAFRHLRIMGIYTHFPAADTDRPFTKEQVKCLYDLVKKLDRSGLIIPYIHAANSMGLAGFKTHILNLARPGLMLYGLYPHPGLRKKIRLNPVLNVRSHVIFLKNVAKGRSISYGRTFYTQKDMLVATVPIGYNDGYFRAFSNKASVLINGVRCPVAGRVTMDQIMVDASRVNGIKLGSSVTVLGSQERECISADELADFADTINYEIVCSLGNRLPRVYK
jgi:alanine racemase